MPIWYLLMGFVMEMFLLHVQNTVYSFLTAEYQIQDCLLVFTANCMRLVALPSSYISFNMQTNKMWLK